MPDYDGYVWAAYGISFLALAAAVIAAWRGFIRARAAGKDLETKT